MGDYLLKGVRALAEKYPKVVREARGLGLMIGIEFEPKLPAFAREEKLPSIQVVNRLHTAGVLTVPAAAAVTRLLPALNLKQSEAEEGLRAIEKIVEELNG
jgi:acetylornithine/succinyldiaminopimelate/putrescine aminotransferase